MNTYTTKFPKTISTKINPIIDLYTKALKSVDLIFGEKKLDVSNFCVNPKDHKKIENSLIVYFTKQNPYISKKTIKQMAGFADLDIGPRVSEEVKEGTVVFIY